MEEYWIYRRREDHLLGPIIDEMEAWKLVVPQEYRDKVLCDAYREMSSEHLGVEKTYERIAREYYCPEMWHEIYHFVEECDDCQRYKTLQTAPKGLM